MHSLVPIRSIVLGLTIALTTLLAGCPATTPTIDAGSDATDDGLHVVQDTNAEQAFARLDADMADYATIVLAPLEITYQPGGESGRAWPSRYRDKAQQVTAEMQVEYDAIAAAEIIEEFGESRRFQLVDNPEADTLLVTIRLLDLVSFIPPDDLARRDITLNEFGEARLILELRDASTQALLARSEDHHVAELLRTGIRIDLHLTSRTQIRELFSAFARELRMQLDDFGALGDN